LDGNGEYEYRRWNQIVCFLEPAFPSIFFDFARFIFIRLDFAGRRIRGITGRIIGRPGKFVKVDCPNEGEAECVVTLPLFIPLSSRKLTKAPLRPTFFGVINLESPI